MALEHLEPKSFFRFFEEFASVPHGSGHTDQAAEYLVKFANDRGIEVVRDGANNVYMRQPATPGYENAPGVILQGHLDMVCDQDKGVGHNFLTDPLTLYVEDGEWIRARGTTLGADDGVAVAMALAVLDSKDIPHGPLEAVFTSDEEVGMLGATAFDGSLLKGHYLINMDTENDGMLLIGCCGGLRADLTLPLERETVAGLAPYRLELKGLLGGHSGEDIHRQRASALVLLARFFTELAEAMPVRIASLAGGIADNAICRESEAVFGVRPADAEALLSFVKQFEATLQKEYAGVETGIEVEAAPVEALGTVLTEACAQKALDLITLLPFGYYFRSVRFENLTETSANPGILEMDETKMVVGMSLRSNVQSRMALPKEQVEALARLTGARVDFYGGYIPWESDPNSALVAKTQATYRELFGEDMQLQAIHGGIECGVFGGKADLDMVSFGPQIDYIHSPRERLSISSTQKYWKFLVELLGRLR